MVFGQLLGWATSGPKYISPDPNGPANAAGMTVLAALAHEFGHVFWYDNFRPAPGGAYDFNTFCGGAFYDNSWQDFKPPRLWREFGDPQYQHKPYDVQISQLALSVSLGTYSKAGDLLHRIYKKEGHWASLFAAFSPDEDFVETFKLYVLANTTTPLRSLPLVYSGTAAYNDDIPADYYNKNKHELKRKTDCFKDVVNGP